MVADFARQIGLTGDYSGLRSNATPISATLGLPKPLQVRFRVVWNRCILTPVLLIAPRSRLNTLHIHSLCRTQPKRRESQEVRFSPLKILPHRHNLFYSLPGRVLSEHRLLAGVALRVPRNVVCLLSALRVHGIGTQAPFEVWLAIPHRAPLDVICYFDQPGSAPLSRHPNI